jgi:hypothetical protein
MLPKTDNRDGGLRDRLRVVYYHFRETGTFPTPPQCSWGEDAVQASENLVLRHERQRAETGGVQGSERGWRSGREEPEKEKWFNYASGGVSGFELSG